MEANSYGTYDDNDEWIHCPKCLYPMMPLEDYEIQTTGEFATIEGDGFPSGAGGWAWFVSQIFYKLLVGIQSVCKLLFGFMTFGLRKKKWDRSKTDLLPQFPNSLICPKCRYVKKRR